MPTAYVRSPISGCISGRDNYCAVEAGETCCNCGDVCHGPGGPHGSCAGGSSRVDICGGAGSAIKLRVNYPTIKSIQTWVSTSGGPECCDGTGCAAQYKRTIKVDLFMEPNQEIYFGTVLYGHVNNPKVSNGQMINLASSTNNCCCISVSTSSNIYSFTL